MCACAVKQQMRKIVAGWLTAAPNWSRVVCSTPPTRRFEALQRVGNFFIFFSIHGCHDNISLKVKKQQGHKGQYHKERESQTGKGMVARIRPLAVGREGAEHDQILICQDH